MHPGFAGDQRHSGKGHHHGAPLLARQVVVKEDARHDGGKDDLDLDHEDGRGGIEVKQSRELQSIGKGAAEEGDQGEASGHVPQRPDEPHEDQGREGEAHAHEKERREFVERSLGHGEACAPQDRHGDRDDQIDRFHQWREAPG